MASKFKLSSKKILDILPYVPGGYAKSQNRLIKLSSNENPFGCSQKVKEAITKELPNLNRYPDGGCTVLRKKLSEFYEIDSNRIICGAGSDEIITFICMAFGGDDAEVIYTKHGFLMYPISALSVGCKPIAAKEKNLKADVDEILKKVTSKTRIVFLANPNNPTGSYVNDKELLRLIKGLPNNVILALDLAYEEYVTEDDYSDGIKLVNRFENVIIMKTFSKAYGIPSLRLGWAYASEYIIDILNRVRGPFNVSSIAQIAGVAALSDQAFVKKSVEHNAKWRAILREAIDDMGFETYPTAANFILVDFGTNKKVLAVDEYLRLEGISGRRMEAYKLPTCIRFTIGLEDENKLLLENLERFVEISN